MLLETCRLLILIPLEYSWSCQICSSSVLNSGTHTSLPFRYVALIGSDEVDAKNYFGRWIGCFVTKSFLILNYFGLNVSDENKSCKAVIIIVFEDYIILFLKKIIILTWNKVTLQSFIPEHNRFQERKRNRLNVLETNHFDCIIGRHTFIYKRIFIVILGTQLQ